MNQERPTEPIVPPEVLRRAQEIRERIETNAIRRAMFDEDVPVPDEDR